jgi:hypothetical protein
MALHDLDRHAVHRRLDIAEQVIPPVRRKARGSDRLSVTCG